MGSPVLTQEKGSSPDPFSSANGTQEKSQHCREERNLVRGQSWGQARSHLCLSEKHLASLPVRTEVGREREGRPGSCPHRALATCPGPAWAAITHPPSGSEGRGSCALLSADGAPGLPAWSTYLHTSHTWMREKGQSL